VAHLEGRERAGLTCKLADRACSADFIRKKKESLDKIGNRVVKNDGDQRRTTAKSGRRPHISRSIDRPRGPRAGDKSRPTARSAEYLKPFSRAVNCANNSADGIIMPTPSRGPINPTGERFGRAESSRPEQRTRLRTPRTMIYRATRGCNVDILP